MLWNNFLLSPCRFLAHPISQAILADLWMGGLRMRKNPIFKIVLGLLCPPSIANLEFKTREELELMPQTEEELQVRESPNSAHSVDDNTHQSPPCVGRSTLTH